MNRLLLGLDCRAVFGEQFGTAKLLIRAGRHYLAVHACTQIARRLGIPERDLDVMLWNRGQAPRYKSRPRHRTRTVYY